MLQSASNSIAGNPTLAPLQDAGNFINANTYTDIIENWIMVNTGLSPLLSDIIASAGIIVIFLVLSQLAKLFVKDIAPHLVRQTESSLDDELLTAIKGPVQVLFIIAGVYLASKAMNDLSLSIISLLDKLATIAMVLIGAYFLSNVISALIRWYVKDVAPHTDSDLDDHLMPFLNKFLIAIVYIIGFIMIIGQFGVEITPLVASLGVVGVAVALAAKESLSNLFGAVAILTDRPYKVGDRLVLQNIGQGDVVDVGLRSTKIKTLDSRIVIVPNEEMARSRIVNMSMPDSKVRLTIKAGIGYKSDVDKACSILEEIASGIPVVLSDPRPKAYVSALGDFAIEITLLAWIGSYREDLNVPDVIYRKTLERFKKEGIEIPYPVVTVKPGNV